MKCKGNINHHRIEVDNLTRKVGTLMRELVNC